MEHRARYKALVEFLLPYQDIWRNEIMLQYPRSLAAYNPAWVEELTQKLSAEFTFELLQGRGWSSLQPSLAAFHETLNELAHFPKALAKSALPVKAVSWVKIIPKKQHELERLAPFIAELVQEQRLNEVVDIGGGVGHLAQTLAHHYGFKVTSLDMDPELQRSGVRWQLHKWEDSPHNVNFQEHRITRQDKKFAALMGPGTLTTGLHTCGGLGVAHMEAGALSRAAVVNMPCCYHKLELTDCNLSSNAQRHPLPWNLFALTLAAGAHRKVTLRDVQFRDKMKFFRYTLHFLLHDEYGIKGQVTLGNCPPELYEGSFAVYVREQLTRLKLTSTWSDEKLDTYFQDAKNQTLIKHMLAAATVRDVMGRALEATIITDRAIWMEEKGYAVDVREVFDPSISPRNIVLLARAQ
jgi:hypothetical protein